MADTTKHAENDAAAKDAAAKDAAVATAAPPPAPPKPLDPPQVFFAAGSNAPPRIVHTQEEADALDKTQWTAAVPAPAPKPEDKPKFPQIYLNINVPPKIVASAEEAAALGPDWRQMDLASQGLALGPAPAKKNGGQQTAQTGHSEHHGRI